MHALALRSYRLIGTTDADGDVVITQSPASPVTGLLHAVEWVDGDLADNHTAALVVTATASGVDNALLSLAAGGGDDDAWFYPRAATHDADGAAGATEAMLVVDGLLKLTIGDGGATKTGGCIVYLLTER